MGSDAVLSDKDASAAAKEWAQEQDEEVEVKHPGEDHIGIH